MQHSVRTLVRVLVTALGIVEIAVGFSLGGNLLIHPGNETGDLMIFIGIVVLGGYWSLAWCNWYSAITVRQLHAVENQIPTSMGVLHSQDDDAR